MLIHRLVKEKLHVFIIVGYMLLTAISGALLNNGLVLFLTINMFLAGIGWLLSIVLDVAKQKEMKLWVLIVLSVVWVLFYPNTMYITTDFIHLQNYNFFEIYGETYTYAFTDWYVFFVLFVGAMISGKIGIESIQTAFGVWNLREHLYKYWYLTGIFILSSVGIYIGRFIRLNSWDFYRVDIILKGIFEEFWFFVGFVGIFVMIHYIFYFIFRDKTKGEIT